MQTCMRPILQKFKTVVGREVYNEFTKVNIDKNVSKSNITHLCHNTVLGRVNIFTTTVFPEYVE